MQPADFDALERVESADRIRLQRSRFGVRRPGLLLTRILSRERNGRSPVGHIDYAAEAARALYGTMPLNVGPALRSAVAVSMSLLQPIGGEQTPRGWLFAARRHAGERQPYTQWLSTLRPETGIYF